MELKEALELIAIIRKNEIGASATRVNQIIDEIHFKYISGLCQKYE